MYLGGRLTLGILWPLGTLRLSEKRKLFILQNIIKSTTHHAKGREYVFLQARLRSTLVHIFAFTEKYKSCHLLL